MSLILTRRDGEAILLYTLEGLVRIEVKQEKRGRTRLTIEAPPTMAVVREEIACGGGKPVA